MFQRSAAHVLKMLIIAHFQLKVNFAMVTENAQSVYAVYYKIHPLYMEY